MIKILSCLQCKKCEAQLLVQRLIADYDQCPPGMRKACSYKEALVKHQACAAFLHFLSVLQGMAPPDFFAEAKTSLHGQFMLAYLDPDLVHALETSVPPGNIQSISSFRYVICQKIVWEGVQVDSS